MPTALHSETSTLLTSIDYPLTRKIPPRGLAKRKRRKEVMQAAEAGFRDDFLELGDDGLVVVVPVFANLVPAADPHLKGKTGGNCEAGCEGWGGKTW